MSLVLNEDQLMLQESARDFCREKATVAVLRKLRDEKDPRGFSDELWQAMVGLGWAGMAIPEAYGGFEFGYSGLGIVLEETGRTLVPTPLVSTVLLCATAINLAGSDAQKGELLPKVAAGEAVLAFALEEGALHRPSNIALKKPLTDILSTVTRCLSWMHMWPNTLSWWPEAVIRQTQRTASACL